MLIMKNKISHILTVALCGALILTLSITLNFKTPTQYSNSERRALLQLPKISLADVLSGKFMKDYESASADQFPLRDEFKSIKAYNSYYILNQKDNNKIFYTDSHLSKLEYPLNQNMIDYATDRFNFIHNKYLKDINAKIYLSVVPDKNYYIADDNNYLHFDYEQFEALVADKMDYARHIDIKTLLSKDCYYLTDTHWRQEKIIPVAEYLCEQMGADFIDNFKVNTVSDAFYGVYYYQSGLKIKPEKLNYLTNDIINNCTVTNYDSGKPEQSYMYDLSKLDSQDLYQVFLSGNVAISVIENKGATTKNELIMFRDSYGSSIAPLMAGSFSKITLVDTRYISPDLLSNFVDFENADNVLFLYSTLLLNNSTAIK